MRIPQKWFVGVAVWCSVLMCAVGRGEEFSAPLSPEEAVKSFRVAPGFKIELMAAEPLVQDPIAFAWGADGKLWVVEMGDYPLGIDGKGTPGGRVKYLEASKSDGHYDKATVFLDHLAFPTGVMPWHKGVLVTCAPDLFYAEDTDGDGKADVRKVLYTGFKEGNQQHRVNGLVYGLDNWIHVANGHSGGKIKSIKTGEEVDFSGRDLRIKPDEGLIEPTTGVTQYGRARDDWGNWFGNDNSNPMFHFVVDDRYLRRNPNAAASQVKVQVSDRPGAAPVYPVSQTSKRFNDPWALNHFTSANSAIVYRDNLFRFGVENNYTFVSEPVHNLVHREEIVPHGVTFTSHRVPGEKTSEFLASTDNWFRPTMLQTGPDGALWIADMYRAVIEHPEWIPKEWQKRLDLRAGWDKGRLYRVYPTDAGPRPIPRLDTLDTAGLIAALDSPSGWQRDTAQRLLIERRDPRAVALLRERAITHPNPLCRLHALCTIDGLGGDAAAFRTALRDAEPGVQRHAVRLCETLAAGAPELGVEIFQLADSPDPQLRMQVAYSLGCWPGEWTGIALGRVVAKSGNDPWVLTAAMSSVHAENLESFAGELLDSGGAIDPAALKGLALSARAMGGPAMTWRLLGRVAAASNHPPTGVRFERMAAVLDALEQSGVTLRSLRGSDTKAIRETMAIRRLFDDAARVAADEKAPLSDRISGTRLLGRGLDDRTDTAQLRTFLSPQTPPELQSAAAATLAHGHGAQTPELLLAGVWNTYGPSLRGQVLDSLLSRAEWSEALLDAIERREVLPNEIDPPRRQRLLKHKTPAIRERAVKLLAATTNPDRAKVVASYGDAVKLTGDAGRGRDVFAKACTTCHKLGNAGVLVGPDLASIGNKIPEGLLTSILDPNAAVETRYVGYLVETRAGDSFIGTVADETGNAITLAVPGGERKTFLRSDLKTLRSTGLSLMPEGLEGVLSHQDMADLIAAIRSSGAARAPKKFDKSRPEVVRPDALNGTIYLLSTNCEIYGSTLKVEDRYGNLGFWQSEDDEAVWSIDVPAAGKYAVALHYACDPGSAGNAFVLQWPAGSLPGVVAATRSWDAYSRVTVGEIEIPAGRQRFTLRAAGKPKGALMDLSDVSLKPVAKKE